MIGLLYLVLNFTVGWAICSYVLPELGALTRLDYRKRDISVSPFLILLPSWYVTGTLAMTWATYLLGMVFQNKEQPLFYANLIVILVAFLGSVLTYLVRKRKALPKVFPAWSGTPRCSSALLTISPSPIPVSAYSSYF